MIKKEKYSESRYLNNSEVVEEKIENLEHNSDKELVENTNDEKITQKNVKSQVEIS